MQISRIFHSLSLRQYSWVREVAGLNSSCVEDFRKQPRPRKCVVHQTLIIHQMEHQTEDPRLLFNRCYAIMKYRGVEGRCLWKRILRNKNYITINALHMHIDCSLDFSFASWGPRHLVTTVPIFTNHCQYRKCLSESE